MKVHFRKEYNKKKPKRWYLFLNDEPVPFDFGSWLDPAWYNDLKIQMRDAGFMEYMCWDRTGYKWSGRYKHVKRFMYFQSPVIEAQFMLWASGGVEI